MFRVETSSRLIPHDAVVRDDRFSWDVDEEAIARAAIFDGKLVLLTNVPEITPADAVSRYKALADIDRRVKPLFAKHSDAP